MQRADAEIGKRNDWVVGGVANSVMAPPKLSRWGTSTRCSASGTCPYLQKSGEAADLKPTSQRFQQNWVSSADVGMLQSKTVCPYRVVACRWTCSSLYPIDGPFLLTCRSP